MISSDNLYHFTPKFEYLTSILNEGLRVSYCLENFSWLEKKPSNVMGFSLTPEQEKNCNDMKYTIPMLCFCDIPSNLIVQHSEVYGRYGIGFEKSWARGKGINPLLYLVDDEYPTPYLQSLNRFTQSIPVDSSDYSHRNALINLLSYTKPYEGTFRGRLKYRFYDEREWRYVPPANVIPRMVQMSENKFKSLNPDRKVADYLGFQSEDVRIVIVDELSEKTMLQKKHPCLRDKISTLADFSGHIQ